MVTNLAFDWATPPYESRQFEQAHSSQCHRDHRFLLSHSLPHVGQLGEFTHFSPAAQKLEPDMPACTQFATERVLGEKINKR